MVLFFFATALPLWLLSSGRLAKRWVVFFFFPSCQNFFSIPNSVCDFTLH
ncbi:hypothetical protein RchiOBHm_Chr1g0330961 [Rosa chinensis]|uniref:Uncharacterized protein n=1 Tax=Rosa chinensis TaxID=74649 RepID=A0A2P6SBD2_ROSCH|nr:hypothetical protein RchiOBHm_Chr1g0330961 [Rosa chinensis]